MKNALKIITAVISIGTFAFLLISGLNLGEGLRQGKSMGKKQVKYL